MSANHLDDLYIANTDPRSPQFKKTMLELQNAALRQKDYRDTLNALIMNIVMAENLEKESLVREQLEAARQSTEKYLKEIVTQQEEKHKAEFEAKAAGLQPKQLLDYLLESTSQLTAHKKELEERLLRLPEIQGAIQTEWSAQQEQAADEFKRSVRSVVSADGRVIELDDKQREQLAEAVFSAPDPVRLCEVVPSLVVMDEKEVPHRAAAMSAHADVMGQIRMIRAMKEAARDREGVAGAAELSTQDCLKIMKNNTDLFNRFAALMSQEGQRQTKTDLFSRALKDNTSYLRAQISHMDKQIKRHDELIDGCRAEMGRPRPSPFR